MPLVIGAVEKYGVEKGFSILRRADKLPQTAATVQWLADELSRDWDLRDVVNDNYCFSVALLLNHADPRLLKPDFAEIRCFPKELKGSFHERLEMATWDWETGWAAFEQFGKKVRQRGHFRLCDIHRGKRLVEACRGTGAWAISSLPCWNASIGGWTGTSWNGWSRWWRNLPG